MRQASAVCCLHHDRQIEGWEGRCTWGATCKAVLAAPSAGHSASLLTPRDRKFSALAWSYTAFGFRNFGRRSKRLMTFSCACNIPLAHMDPNPVISIDHQLLR